MKEKPHISNFIRKRRERNVDCHLEGFGVGVFRGHENGEVCNLLLDLAVVAEHKAPKVRHARNEACKVCGVERKVQVAENVDGLPLVIAVERKHDERLEDVDVVVGRAHGHRLDDGASLHGGVELVPHKVEAAQEGPLRVRKRHSAREKNLQLLHAHLHRLHVRSELCSVLCSAQPHAHRRRLRVLHSEKELVHLCQLQVLGFASAIFVCELQQC